MNLKLGDTKPLLDFIKLANANEADVKAVNDRKYQIYHGRLVYELTPSHREGHEGEFEVSSIRTVSKGRNPFK